MSNNKETIFKLLRLDGPCSIVVHNGITGIELPEYFKEKEISIVNFSALSKMPIIYKKDSIRFKLRVKDELKDCEVPWESIIGLIGIDTRVEFGLDLQAKELPYIESNEWN
jgi:stringent starvation protein B